MKGAESLLCSLLDCGYMDLDILEDVGYDLGKIASDLVDEGIKPTLNAITDMIFRKGVEDLKEKIHDRLRELDDVPDEIASAEEVEEKRAKLESLDPDEDIEWFCNCLDTSIYFVKNNEIYQKYLEPELTDIESDMGFDFQG